MLYWLLASMPTHLIQFHSGHTLSVLWINTLPEETTGVMGSPLILMHPPAINEVTIERFCDMNTILADEIPPRFRSHGGEVDIGNQHICI